MGRCQMTVAFQANIENSSISDQESINTIEIPADLLFQVVNNLRNDLVSDMDDASAEEFTEAMVKAAELNQVVEKFEGLMVDEDEE